jgi:5-methyltetrahydropteroyltriglutamate--homocysteine methyltransferase
VQRSTDRILTTHTGSLPRPEELIVAFKARENGGLENSRAFEGLLENATIDIVGKQLAAGVDVVNDGEMSKGSYSTYVAERLNGFGGQGSFPRPVDVGEHPDFARRMQGRLAALTMPPACIGPISWKDRSAVPGDIARLKKALAGKDSRDAFMTAASPGVIALFLENQYYPSHEAYLAALSEVMREEYETIAAAGFILQLDCPDLGVGRHSRVAATVPEFVSVAEQNVSALNRAIANIPAEQVRLHLCWGNYEGPHHLDIPLRDIIATVFEAHVAAISFEGANPRHAHEWAIFKDVKLPPGKILIPGVLDTSTNYVEHPELVAERIIRYAELVGRENVIAGSDCGFSTFASSDPPIAPSITWAKLRALSEGAAIASRQLWRS